MTNEIRFSIASVVADLRRDVATASRHPGDLQRNAALWLAVRAGTRASTSSFSLPAAWHLDITRFADAAYLSAMGFAFGTGDIESPQSRAELGNALAALMKRRPHTIERGGFADDPLCASGLVVLAKSLGMDAPTQIIAQALQDGPAMSAAVGLTVACSGARHVEACPLDMSAAGLAAAILCDRIEPALRRTVFPSVDAETAEQHLIHGLCRGTFDVGHGFEAMLTLAALELELATMPITKSHRMHQTIDPSARRTILFLAANPGTSGQLALDEEARAIATKLRASAHRDGIQFHTRWAVRPDDLLQALNEDRPSIVHFSGHGAGKSGIVLHDAVGGDRLVTGGALKRLFTALKGDIRIVVLSACYSSEQAREIASVIDVVVGMSDSVGDEAARAFAAAFYRALGFGHSVQNAFDQGIVAIDIEGLDGTDVPELLVRAGVDAAKLVLVG